MVLATPPKRRKPGSGNLAIGKPLNFTDEEKRHFIEQARALIVDEHWSRTDATDSVAEEMGILTGQTIVRWAKRMGCPLPYGDNFAPVAKAEGYLDDDEPDNLTHVEVPPDPLDGETPPEYGQEQRQRLSNRLFHLIWMTAGSAAGDAKATKDLVAAFTTLTETRRIEDGAGASPNRPFSEDDDMSLDLESVMGEGRALLKAVGGNRELIVGEKYDTEGRVRGRELTVREKYGRANRPAREE